MANSRPAWLHLGSLSLALVATWQYKRGESYADRVARSVPVCLSLFLPNHPVVEPPRLYVILQVPLVLVPMHLPGVPMPRPASVAVQRLLRAEPAGV